MSVYFYLTSKGRRYLPYDLDKIETIAVEEGERFELVVENKSNVPVCIKFAIDGVNPLTGKPPVLYSPENMFLVNAHSIFRLDAWPETMEGGGAFVFADKEKGVAGKLLKDSPAKGYITAAIYNIPGSIPVQYYASAQTPYSGLGVCRAHAAPPSDTGRSVSANTAKTLGGAEKDLNDIKGFTPETKELAVGKGSYKEQKLQQTTVTGTPMFSHFIQYRYLPRTLVHSLLLQKQVPPPHPTGFLTQPLVDLSSVPNAEEKEPVHTKMGGYSRFYELT